MHLIACTHKHTFVPIIVTFATLNQRWMQMKMTISTTCPNETICHLCHIHLDALCKLRGCTTIGICHCKHVIRTITWASDVAHWHLWVSMVSQVSVVAKHLSPSSNSWSIPCSCENANALLCVVSSPISILVSRMLHC